MERGGGLRSLRDANQRRVIEALGQRGVASRADIARATGLSRTTVSSLVGDLKGAGLLVERAAEGDGQDQSVGRPPVLLSFDRSAGAVIGIDFGHSHIGVVVGDLSHAVLAELWQDVDVDSSASHGLDIATELVESALDQAEVERDRVLGVGMGIPGPITTENGTVGSTSILPGWVGVDAASVVGDSVWDMLAARRARVLGIGVLSGGYGLEELERAGAYRVYEDPSDLLEHLDEVGGRR